VFELEMKILENKAWKKFTPSDTQIEAIMLDPYIRKTMVPKNGILVSEFKLPDQCGVFKFKVDYRRVGLTNVDIADIVQVRPFRHNQHPRFLINAYPYYINIFSLMAAFFMLSGFLLFHKDSPVGKKVKKE